MSQGSESFSPRALGWIIGLSVGSFLFAFLMAAYGDDLSEPRSAGSDSFSYSALGHRGLVEFLEGSGVAVDVRRSRKSRTFGPAAPLIVAEPGGVLSMGADSILELNELALQADAPLVIVLPKWFGRVGGGGAWVDEVALRPLDPVDEGLAEFAANAGLEPFEVRRRHDREEMECEMPHGGRTYAVDLESPQWLDAVEGWEPVVRCDDKILVARASLAPWEESPDLFLISDPDLLNNHGLGRAQHADLILETILGVLSVDRVVLDETIHGFARSDGVVAELLRFPLVVPVVHLLIVAGVGIWAGSGRLGRPVPVAPRLIGGKRVLIDNAAQLLNLGGHSAEALDGYYDQTLRAVGKHYFFRPDLPLDELRRKLQTISRDRGLTLDLIALERRMARAGTERGVRLAHDLHRWRLEMTHDR